MKTSMLFLASMVLIALACLPPVQGQYVTANTYSSSASTPSSTSSAIPQYGIVLSIKDENSMYVNFTKSNISGMAGMTLILLPQPVPMRDLVYFQGKELSFSLLGHDVLGRPVCDAYFEGVPIDYYLKRYERYGNYAPWHEYYPPRYGYYSPGYVRYSSGSLQISEST